MDNSYINFNNKFDNYYKPTEFIFINPSILPDTLFEKQALEYLPADTGIEIECSLLDTYDRVFFDKLPNLVENKSCINELRFRIPKGIKGLKCLWDICVLLNQHCQVSLSGIHIHVDITGYYDKLSNPSFIEKISDYVLEELDSWGYKGTYNRRDKSLSSGWVTFQPGFQTIEFRICEMTFDYTKLIKRIIHCHYIRKSLLLRHKEHMIDEYKKVIESGYNDLKCLEEKVDIFTNIQESLDRIFTKVQLV